MRTWAALAVVAALAALVAGLVCLPHLPDSMAVHWSGGDQPDGYLPKIAAVIVIPALAVAILSALAVLGGLVASVRDQQYRKAMRLAWMGTVVPLTLLLTYTQGIVLLWNLGVHVPVGRYVLPGLAVLIGVIILTTAPLLRLSLVESRLAAKTLPSGVWFPAKRYGWGWGLPCAWQGWAAMGLWLAVLLAGEVGILWLAPGGVAAGAAVAFALLMAGVLTGLCYWKGECPRWRWGD